jgi:zinc protease
MKATQIILAAAALAGAAPASAKLDLTHADVSHLANGLTVILLEDHSFPLLSVQMLYKSGSAAETTGKTGLAHFLEHLAFRASESFPKAQATELIYDAGGEWHGYTAMDQTTYFATMPKDGLELLLTIEADRMARTIIDPAAIQAEKGAVITELHGYENDPASVLQETVTRTALQAHPYGSPMAGYVSDVERLTIDDARAYYASHYAPGNAVLAVVGDFTTPEAKAIVTKAFSGVPSRPVEAPNLTVEPPQKGERRTEMLGPVHRSYFHFAYPAPASSSPDLVPFLVLQEILSGGSGLNLRQSDWAGTKAAKGSLLHGLSDDVATWLPPTRDPFLFTISGSIAKEADNAALEREIEKRIATLRDRPIPETRLREAKAAVIRAIGEDVLTTEDAAHQLAFFEGIGALDYLLDMPSLVAAVKTADIQRVARIYLTKGRRTTGWMVPGKPSPAPAASGKPRRAADRAGTTSVNIVVSEPQLRRLSGGLPAIVQQSGFSDTATVELLLSAPTKGNSSPEDLPGLDAIVRSGKPAELTALVRQTLAAARAGPATAEPPSEDPATRLQQLISAGMGLRSGAAPVPLAVIVSGNLDVSQTVDILERQLGSVVPGTKRQSHRPPGPRSKLVRERIGKPLSQGAIGYVVEAPAPGTREALAWRMLLYVLTHDYSGRLGWSAISDKGLVYHIYSSLRTDGQRSWVTISTGVDPDKADAMEAELRAQLARLASEPPSQTEVDVARNHLLGRDLTAAQSNEELTAKWTRQFVETGGVQAHEDLRRRLNEISVADLANAARDFANGTIIRIDVDRP